MKTLLRLLLLVAMVVALSNHIVSARGQRIPLPPSFHGGNAGAWLGNGPLFGFDTPLEGDFFGGIGTGGAVGSEWDPIGSGPGGSGNAYPCPGNCWTSVPVGPCTPICDCYPSDMQLGVNECIRITPPKLGTASECKDEFGLGCRYP